MIPSFLEFQRKRVELSKCNAVDDTDPCLTYCGTIKKSYLAWSVITSSTNVFGEEVYLTVKQSCLDALSDDNKCQFALRRPW